MSEYYIRHVATPVGNSVLWWKPKSCGYTVDLNRAGKYSAEKAASIAAIRPGEDIPHGVDDMDAIAERHVDIQNLTWPLTPAKTNPEVDV